jgi:2-(1,2-epoxy-1,2-dihydrophenyl)acetyl-CoA isomerase
MSSDRSPVLVSISGGVAIVTLNRPELLNALDNAMADSLLPALERLAVNDAARVVVLRGAGDGFMAGGDVAYFQRLLTERNDPALLRPIVHAMIDRVQQAVLTLRAMPKPVIASVHGGCAGFGLSLMLAADMAIAAENTKFTMAYIHLATTPDGGASFHLPRVVGQKRAAEIALLGDRFGAVEAERWGMVNRVVPLAELQGATAKLAARLAMGPAKALAQTKKLLNQSSHNSLEAQLAAETDSFAASALTGDFATGVAAFLGKHPPAFHGE